jgi:hypothetical protein
MCLLGAASRSRRRRAADTTACGAKFVKTARSGWIDATKRLKKLERRVGDGRNIGLGASVVKSASTNPGAIQRQIQRLRET